MTRGISAWLDKWEILPGDSLVQKIFGEGLAEATGVVILLSAVSVTKPWVAAELDIAVVKRIQGGTRLIPVLVDDCQVPESLSATLWIRLSQVGSIEALADRIRDAMLGQTGKPELGVLRSDGGLEGPTLPGLKPTDNKVLKALYEITLKGNRNLIQYEEIAEQIEREGIKRHTLIESVDVLVTTGHLRSRHQNSRDGHYVVEMPSRTILRLAAATGVNLPDIKRQIAGRILNEQMSDVEELSSKSGLPKGLVEAVIEQFETNGFLSVARWVANSSIHSATPSFRRWLEST